jgi:hypothetical protein
MYSKYTLKSVRIYAAVVIVVASAMQLLHTTVVKNLRVAGGDNAIATATTVVNSI